MKTAFDIYATNNTFNTQEEVLRYYDLDASKFGARLRNIHIPTSNFSKDNNKTHQLNDWEVYDRTTNKVLNDYALNNRFSGNHGTVNPTSHIPGNQKLAPVVLKDNVSKSTKLSDANNEGKSPNTEANNQPSATNNDEKLGATEADTVPGIKREIGNISGNDDLLVHGYVSTYVNLLKECYDFLDLGLSYSDDYKDVGIDYMNFTLNNPICGGGDMNISGNITGWWDAVEKMGAWYQQNIHTYQGTVSKPRTGRKAYPCNLINGNNVFDDCSSFVTACVLAFGINKPEWTRWPPNTETMQPDSDWDRTLRANGFRYIPFSADVLQVGDIYCGGPRTHVEICAGRNPNKQYGWGSIHDKLDGRSGMPCGAGNYNTSGGGHSYPYMHIWRYMGS